MADKADPFYSIELSGSSVQFRTPAAFSKWVESQQSAWQPILEIDSNTLRSQQIRNLFDRARNHLRKLFEVASAYGKSPSDELKGQLDTALRNIVVDFRVPVTSRNFAVFLDQLRQTRGPIVAAAALATLGTFPRDHPIDLHLPEVRIGMAAAELFQLGVEPTIPAANAEALAALTAEFEARLAALEDQKKELENSAGSALASATAAAAEQRSKDRLDVDESLATFGENAKAATESLKATEAAYVEQMRLQAAVTYWTDQSASHRTTEKTVRLWLIIYACAASLGLLILLNVLASSAADSTVAANIAQYVKYAAIGVLATTLVIWIGRLLLRIFLSERHLAIDAEERVTMVKTYLALTKEAKLEASDRPLVLAALFRPGSDGIVKDDASPDAMLGGILGRMIDRMSGKG